MLVRTFTHPPIHHPPFTQQWQKQSPFLHPYFFPFLKHFIFLLLFCILYTWIKRNITSTCQVNVDLVIHYNTSCMSLRRRAMHSLTHASVCMSECSCSFWNIFESTMSQCELQHCLNIPYDQWQHSMQRVILKWHIYFNCLDCNSIWS